MLQHVRPHACRTSVASDGWLCRPSLPQQHADQFQPFCAFGCDMEHEFQGTMFRFPLRTPQLASRSRISTQVCTMQDSRSAKPLESVAAPAPIAWLSLGGSQVVGPALPVLLMCHRLAPPPLVSSNVTTAPAQSLAVHPPGPN